MPNNTVRISVKFVTIMQDYSGRRLVEMDAFLNAARAISDLRTDYPRREEGGIPARLDYSRVEIVVATRKRPVKA